MPSLEMSPTYKAIFRVVNNNTWRELFCKMTQSQASMLGITESDMSSAKAFTGVLTRNKYCSSKEIGIFITVQIDDEVQSTARNNLELQDHALVLFACDIFMSHYSLSDKDVVFIQKARCLPLKSVVFGARTDAAYEWTQSKEWSKNLLQHVTQQPILCRRGDILQLNHSLFPDVHPALLLEIVVLDCSPVLQGLLTFSTRILVLRAPWQPPTSQETHSPEIPAPYMQKMINLLGQMKFASNLLLPVSSGKDTSPPGVPAMISGTLLRAFNRKFKITIMTKPMIDTNKVDAHSTVFLNQQVLQSFSVAEGSWAKVRLTPQKLERDSWGSDPTEVGSGSTTPVRVPVRQASIPAGEDDMMPKRDECLVRLYVHREPRNLAYVTPLLWFNMNPQPSPLEQPNRKIILENLMVEPPPYAREVYICLIHTPFYKASINSDALLKQYFGLTRCLRKGDIIALPTSSNADAHNQNWKECLVYPVVYFEVSTIEGPPSTHYLVDTLSTRLYQAGANQNYLPVTMETYGSPWPMHPLWHSPKPPGLERHVDRLCQLITPFLQNREFRGQVSSCILIRGQSGTGKSLVVKATSRCLNVQIFVVESQNLVGESAAATEARFKQVATKALTYAPCILLLKDVCSVSKEKEASGEDPRVVHSLCEMMHSLGSPERSYPVVVIATSMLELSADLQSVFLHQINLDPPDQPNRELILRSLLFSMETSTDLSLEYFSQRTAGMVLGDLQMLVGLASQETFARLKKEIAAENLSDEEETVAVALSGVPVTHADMTCALEKMHQAYAEAIGAPQIPDVRWEDIGGLEEARKELLDTVQLPLTFPHLTQSGLRRSGVLLHGPPGTGKTLLAKAVATECSLSFLSVKGPELINRYVGQSEENIREVFRRARSAAPCIIFFDELDSLGPNRGRSGDSGGVMDRVVSQLLAELDGLHKSNQVFVIGATNRPDLLDSALLRPGRFDRLVQVGIARTAEGRLGILRALTRKFNMNPDIDLAVVESECPQVMSGADFYGLCAEANMASMARCICLIEEGSLTESEARPEVTMEDFRCALRTIRPQRAVTD